MSLMRSGDELELVAHRAGNTIETIAAAASVADVIELDVHLFRGRLEVRHAKVFWPTKVQWDRWWIDRHPTTPPDLLEIATSTPDGTPLWIDLKGFSTRLTRAALRELTATAGLTTSTRSWWVLRPARKRGIRTMRSVGSRWQVWAVRRIRRWAPGDGVVLNQRYATPELISRLRRRTDSVVVWAVDDLRRATDLLAIGVTGLIIDDLELIAEIRALTR